MEMLGRFGWRMSLGWKEVDVSSQAAVDDGNGGYGYGDCASSNGVHLYSQPRAESLAADCAMHSKTTAIHMSLAALSSDIPCLLHRFDSRLATSSSHLHAKIQPHKKNSHDHLLAAEERVADELAGPQGNGGIVVGHDVGFLAKGASGLRNFTESKSGKESK